MRKIEKRLRDRIKVLETERDDLQKERALFREHFSNRFRWWIKLIGEGKSPSLAWLIEDDAKRLNNLSWWYW